jgi:hypothetical protein
MAYYTDGNGNYYCGQFLQQINFSYNTSSISRGNAGNLRNDLIAIFTLLNFPYQNVSTDMNDIYSEIYWRTASNFDPNRYSVMKNYNESTRINGLISAGNNNNDWGGTSYIVNQYGMISVKHNYGATASYAVLVNTELIDVNPTIPTNGTTGYYTSNYLNKLFCYANSNGENNGSHYIAQLGTVRNILLTNEAVYGITCNDAQIAGTDLWMTKLHVFDSTLRSNGVSTKCSRIGTVPNMAIGVGTSWVIGRIYEPATNLFPGSNNKWLCAQRWNNLSNRYILVNVWSA